MGIYFLLICVNPSALYLSGICIIQKVLHDVFQLLMMLTFTFFVTSDPFQRVE